MSEVVQTTLINHEDKAEVSTICKWGKCLTHFTNGLRSALVEKGQPFDVVVVSYFLNDRIDYDADLPITRGQDEDYYISENVALAEALCSCANRAIVLLGGESYFTEMADREEKEYWAELAITTLTNEGVKVRRVTNFWDSMPHVDGMHLKPPTF